MKKALVLDDRPSRHRLLSARHRAAYDMVHVDTAQAAIEELCTVARTFSLVCLDHELGDPAWTGMAVVNAVARQAEDPAHRERFRQARWRVHSMDGVAAKEMIRVLRAALGHDAVDEHEPLP